MERTIEQLRAAPQERAAALLAVDAGNAYIVCMQYTLRNIPAAIDRMLRRRVRETGSSLNEVAIEALARGVGVSDDAVKYRDLHDLAGSWREDADFDAAIRDQDKVDEQLWR